MKAEETWKTIYQPNEKGGLCLSDLVQVNKACITKSIGEICNNKEILWIKWIYSVIKGARTRASDSWLWKKTLCVRDLYCSAPHPDLVRIRCTHRTSLRRVQSVMHNMRKSLT